MENTVKGVIEYVNNAIESRKHGGSYWIDEKGKPHTTDVGYGIEWWDIVKEELIRVFTTK